MESDTGKKARRFDWGWGLVLLALVVVMLSISTPSCPHRIYKAKMARAFSEIKGVELALTKMMADAEVRDMRELFAEPAALSNGSFEETLAAQTSACYDLLRHGKNAQAALKPEVREKLGPTYMELPNDPWKQRYRFYFGPLIGSVNSYMFRGYRGEDYVYDVAKYEEESKLMRGQIKPDADTPPAKGYPCPGDLPVYIFSYGRNGEPDQLPWGGNGGDDVNNWDNMAGWSAWY